MGGEPSARGREWREGKVCLPAVGFPIKSEWQTNRSWVASYEEPHEVRSDISKRTDTLE